MKNSLDVSLSIFLYRYMNQNAIINKIHPYIKEKTITMDTNFKEELKQHFRTLSLMDKNNAKGNI